MRHRFANFFIPLAARSWRLFRRVSPASRNRYQTFRQIKEELFEEIWLCAVRKLEGSIEKVYGGFHRIRLDDRVTYIRESSVFLDSHLALNMAGNKVLIYKILGQSNLITPPKYCPFSVDDSSSAFDFFDDFRGDVVVKPASSTGAGAGVITNIATHNVLTKAIIQAGSFCNDMLIEEQVPGRSYRLLYLGGELIDAIERQPPIVVGNGTDNILRLVRMENDLRIQARGSRATGPIDIDLEMSNCLRRQGKTLRTIPALNETVRLKNVVNQNNALTNLRVFDSVHATFRDLGGKVADLLSLDLVGVDIIAADISSPAHGQVFAMNDINTKPGLHHHYLLANRDKNHDVAAQILQYIFSDRRNSLP